MRKHLLLVATALLWSAAVHAEARKVGIGDIAIKMAIAAFAA
jgi:hypothetical protein